MNKTDMVKALTNKGVADASTTLDAMLDLITLGLACGEDIVLRNFGKFQPRTRPPVTRHNPRTGIKVSIPERQSVAFVPSPRLKDRLNGGGR